MKGIDIRKPKPVIRAIAGPDWYYQREMSFAVPVYREMAFSRIRHQVLLQVRNLIEFPMRWRGPL